MQNTPLQSWELQSAKFFNKAVANFKTNFCVPLFIFSYHNMESVIQNWVFLVKLKLIYQSSDQLANNLPFLLSQCAVCQLGNLWGNVQVFLIFPLSIQNKHFFL